MPNQSFFPFDTLEAQTAKPERWTPSPNEPAQDDQLAAQATAALRLNGSARSDPAAAAAHITVPKVLSETDITRKIDLATALQYGTAAGYPPLLSFIRQFTREQLHPNVPYEGGPEVVLTVGATDGFSKVQEMFVDPWSPSLHDIRDRPGILCETFIYGQILNQVMPKGVQVVSVKADAGGMVASGPGSLEDTLENWDYSRGRRPHLLYTVTMGHNPTGVVLSVERRKALYALCSKYDVIIIEDDPYWYLQFPSAAIEESKSRNKPPVADAFTDPAFRRMQQAVATNEKDNWKSSGYAFLDSLVPSFLSFDTDGRVVRLDTFSKTVAPGCRLGWITAQPKLIERVTRIAEVSTQQPSGFVQSVISELIMGQQPAAATTGWLSLRSNKERTVYTGWQTDGWVRWLAGLRGEYERRMARMCRILDDGSVYIKQGTPRAAQDADVCVLTKTQLYDYNWPRGGMFVWVRIFLQNHPLYGVAHSDGRTLVEGGALAMGLLIFLTRAPFSVVISPGLMFSSTDEVKRTVGWQYFRLCFAAETEENIDLYSERFAKGVRKFWGMKDVKELEDLTRDLDAAADKLDEEVGNLGSYMGC
ncbi:aromatic amino acid aminotransferase [Coniella lustricola]|uniref:Aromatic amino acid aminotransferase n=1 Tax=Coniella lustricola TaxID=2025994 RepID=A0A2T3AF25_9PEZI|nr:aromatic amino acid aminotransferase [Coniella lustricola]